MSSFGVAYMSNGDRYEGQFHDGKKFGLGVYLSQDGTEYEGSYHSDVKHGEGFLYLPGGQGVWQTYENGSLVTEDSL